MKKYILPILLLLLICCNDKKEKTKSFSTNTRLEVFSKLEKYQNSQSVIDALKFTYRTMDSIEVRVDTMKMLSVKDKENYKKIKNVTIKDIETACNNVFLNLSDYERIKILKTTEKSILDQKEMLKYLYRKLNRENLKRWKK